MRCGVRHAWYGAASAHLQHRVHLHPRRRLQQREALRILDMQLKKQLLLQQLVLVASRCRVPCRSHARHTRRALYGDRSGHQVGQGHTSIRQPTLPIALVVAALLSRRQPPLGEYWSWSWL
jgi:hypothetical protein